MNATARKPKLAKIAGLGCSAAVALVVALGVIFWLIGTYAPDVEEPAAQEPAPAAEAEPTEEPAEPTEDPEPAPEPEPTEEPAPEPEPEPEPTTEPEPEPEPTEEPEPVKEEEPAEDGTGVSIAHAQQVQSELDIWFEECDWEDDESDGYVMSICRDQGLGIVIGPGESSVQAIIDAMGEESVGGGYFYADETLGSTVAVWAVDTGTMNRAWDAMGAPGTPTRW